MSIYIAHRRRKTSNALDTLVLSEQKNVLNERLKDPSLHVESRRSADSEFQFYGDINAKPSAA